MIPYPKIHIIQNFLIKRLENRKINRFDQIVKSSFFQKFFKFNFLTNVKKFTIQHFHACP